MLPGVYEFAWDAGHIIFLGAFFMVLAVIATTLVVALFRAVKHARPERIAAERWHLDFEDMPREARACRHELTGEVKERKCPNAFDCRHCSEHLRFLATPAELPSICYAETVAGLEVPGDRFYHRGHTWVREEPDGTVTIGLDDLGKHLMGEPDEVKLPLVGMHLVANDTGWVARKGGARVRVLSPVDGEVTAIGGAGDDWYLRMRPDAPLAGMRHLLEPTEARPWMLREFERLQMAIGGGSLADGGLPVDDLSTAIPRDQFDDVCGLMFLEP